MSSRAATTGRQVSLEHEEVALDTIESNPAVWAPPPADAGQSHRPRSHIQHSPLAGQSRLTAALCVMVGADAMEVDKPAPVWRTALRLVSERFASMELFKDAVKTVKEVKLMK